MFQQTGEFKCKIYIYVYERKLKKWLLTTKRKAKKTNVQNEDIEYFSKLEIIFRFHNLNYNLFNVSIKIFWGKKMSFQLFVFLDFII